MQLTRVIAYPGSVPVDRRRTDSGVVTNANWGDRTTLLLEVPDAKAADRASARPFRAALVGSLVGLVSVLIFNAAVSFLDAAPADLSPPSMVMASRVR